VYSSADSSQMALKPAIMPQLLRLSVTDLCNFRCRYCMPLEGVPKVVHEEILPLEELAGLAGWLSSHVGIRRVRLTGGEPLARRGICHLIEQLSASPTITEIALTTNGSLLAPMALSLKAAGLKRVNISLDSVDEKRFAEVTRGGSLKQTMEGIDAAKNAGLTPIKLNAVLQRSTWKQEVPCLLDYAASTGFEIRFIELMRTGTERAWSESEFISADEVCHGLGVEFAAIEDQNPAPARATMVNWHGNQLTVGWITPRSHSFCGQCERLRMDVRGRIRRCLMDPAIFDLPQALATMDEQSALLKFQEYMAGKAPPRTMDSSFAMSQMGG
jgi:cyclic pyranopterin phosphate synthase